MAMVGVDSGSLQANSQPKSVVWGSAAAWRRSACTFIKWTGWTFAIALPWWQHHKHRLDYHHYYFVFFWWYMAYQYQLQACCRWYRDYRRRFPVAPAYIYNIIALNYFDCWRLYFNTISYLVYGLADDEYIIYHLTFCIQAGSDDTNTT